ncbi:cell envelope integrity protein CreD [Roseivirga sp.]|uniref:cell envelope integrity protein CreD n=1 Tax=Roseivirga sp. TaxID=1964215 RepID=UPI003B52E0AC
MDNSTNGSVFDKINYSIKNSVSIKLLSIGFLIAILLIPNSMIKTLINEREYRQEEAIREISGSWASPQQITGPILTIPYESVVILQDKEVSVIKYAHFLPQKLEVDGQINPQSRKRGIYEVAVYAADLQLKGNFTKPDFTKLIDENDKVLWDQATISMGIPDMRGIQSKIEIKLGEKAHSMESGIPKKFDLQLSQLSSNYNVSRASEYQSGVSANISWPDEIANLSFSTHLSLHGTRSLKINPIGKSTTAKMSSSWPHPSFEGQFLPDDHSISEDGFTAEWSIFDLNRNYPQQWVGGEHSISDSEFGVKLFQPVDNYQQNTRSAKYAVLILFLTFISFFFIEILNKKRIHPIHYILVGLTLTIFYTLLLSLSEHLDFSAAYWVSSTVIIGMISLYSMSILKSRKLAGILFLFFSIIYTFIFVVLKLEDFALLFGSVGLLIVLGICMYLSRNVDWYNIKSKGNLTHATTEA